MPNISNKQFEAVSYDKWREAAQTALGGRDISKITKHTYDNIAVKALYQSSVASNQVALPSGAWQICQSINHPNISTSTKQIDQDLTQGVNALSL